MRVTHLWKTMFSHRALPITNTATCGLLFVIGDGIQQHRELYKGVHASSSYDWYRARKLFLVGLSQGPPHHYFYAWLDKVFPKITFASISKKILVDQMIAAPFFAVSFFLVAGLLEAKTLKGCFDEFKQKFPAIYLFDWCLWPPAQAINFIFVPQQYRVLYINFVTVGWDIYLSYMKHREERKSKNS